MASLTCRTCRQPVANCGRSDRRAMSCDMHIMEHSERFALVPCYFKEKINELADTWHGDFSWLVARTGHHLFDFALLKIGIRIFLCGPFWRSFRSYFDIVVGDVLKIECFENPKNALPAKVYVTVTNSAGNEKPYLHLGGNPLWEVPSCVRPTLHKTVFNDIGALSEPCMTEFIWELCKEVGRFYEDEFYHVPDLQYYVKKLNPADLAPEFLSIPKGLVRGYSYPPRGNVLYWNRRMVEPIWGEYQLHRSKIELRTGFDTLCNQLQLGVNHVILVKVEVRDLGIALEVEKIGI